MKPSALNVPKSYSDPLSSKYPKQIMTYHPSLPSEMQEYQRCPFRDHEIEEPYRHDCDSHSIVPDPSWKYSELLAKLEVEEASQLTLRHKPS